MPKLLLLPRAILRYLEKLTIYQNLNLKNNENAKIVKTNSLYPAT